MRGKSQLESHAGLTLAITTYERPEYLRDCLESVRRQTDRDFRVVVIDNASSKDYTAVISAFTDLGVEYVRNPTNLGGAGNIALALERYRGPDFTIVFHDDDIMHPRLIEWQRGVLECNPEIIFVATEVLGFEDSDAPPLDAFDSIGDPPFEVFENDAELARAILAGAPVGFGTVMYRTSILDEVHMDLETYGMYCDRPFLLDIARRGKCALARAPYILSRWHEGQESRTDALTVDNLVELQKRYRRALGPRWGARDREVFYRRAKGALLGDYLRFSDERRPSLVGFLSACVLARVLRLRDLSRTEWFDLLRVGGFGWVLEAGVGVKRVWRGLTHRNNDGGSSE
jgi:glycosyltransferase involved in cell wall biosynthesis